MTPLHLTIAEEYTNKDKTGYEPAFKKLKFWPTKTTGMGYKTKR
jgi:hypothetical protein